LPIVIAIGTDSRSFIIIPIGNVIGGIIHDTYSGVISLVEEYNLSNIKKWKKIMRINSNKQKRKAPRNITKIFKLIAFSTCGALIIGAGITVGISGCSCSNPKEPPVTLKNMPWDEAKNYFVLSDYGDGQKNQIDNFLNATSNYNLMKTCKTTGYSGIEIGSQVSSIKNSAFSGCTAFGSGSPIKSIVMSSVTSIGNYAFSGCAGLTTINLGGSSISVGYSAFYSCTNAVFSGTPTISSIGNGAFEGCAELSKDFVNGITVTGCTKVLNGTSGVA
jgi:hypothetical protein